MKHIRLILFSVITVLFLGSCTESDTVYKTFPVPDWTLVTNYVQSRVWSIEESAALPAWKLDLTGNDEAPQWNNPAEGVYQSSMTAVIRLSDFLQSYANGNDRIAAFVGDECRGTASPQDVEEQTLYFLYIKGNTSETDKVTLAYYSAANKKIYTCTDLLAFEQNGIYGTASDPQTPPFNKSGKYPYVMNAVVSLPDDFVATPQTDDKIGAFAGNDCRGVTVVTPKGDKGGYALEIRGTEESTQRIDFKYYSVADKKIYTCSASVPFEAGKSYGTETEPVVLPSFLEGKYPLTMPVVVRLPENLRIYRHENDKLAAFVGNECRGIGTPTSNTKGETVYKMDVIGNADQTETVHFKYYNAKTSYMYEDRTDVIFDAKSHYGTEENAVVLNLKNIE